MTSRQAKNSRTAVVSAKVAHILAWAAFLWIAFWPHSYQGVALIDVGVDGSSTMTTEAWMPFCLHSYQGVSVGDVNIDGSSTMTNEMWMPFCPHSYQGVSVADVSVDGSSTTTSVMVRYTRSFADVNGYWALIPLFAPVLVTAMALLSLLIWKGGRAGKTLTLSGLAVILLALCVLELSIGVLYLPAAIVSIVTAAVFGLRIGWPKLNDEGKE